MTELPAYEMQQHQLNFKLFFTTLTLFCLGIIYVSFNYLYSSSPVLTNMLIPKDGWSSLINFRQEESFSSMIESKESSKEKIILYWNSFNPSMGDQPLVDAKCPETRCIFTDDLTLFDQSDVVLLYINTLAIKDLPTHRFPHQKFVFYAMESQTNTNVHLMNDSRIRNNYFNWTMTYRSDSDIVIRDIYGGLEPKIPTENALHSAGFPFPEPKNDFDLNLLKNKTKLVAWVVSGCQSWIRREEYARQLGQFVPVDIYGRCGNLSRKDGDYWNMLRREYKFYLAFENSWCPDYVSEKFYRSLLFDAVPIVLSPTVEYTRFAPAGSFINALDFESPRDLADYLLLLDKNEALYASYFEWKRHYNVVIPSMRGWCDLCRMTHDENQPTKIYPDIKEWWLEKFGCMLNSTDYF